MWDPVAFLIRSRPGSVSINFAPGITFAIFDPVALFKICIAADPVAFLQKRYRVSDAERVCICDPVALFEKRYRVSLPAKVRTADPVALFRKCYRV